MKLLAYEVDKRPFLGVFNEDETWAYPISAAGMEYRSMKDLIREAGPSEMEMLDYISKKAPGDVTGAAPVEEIKIVSPIPEPDQDIIIKKDAKDVKPEEVKDYIFGYTIMNDVSAREVQTEHKQWYFGKSLDGFTPLGPCIMTVDSTAFPPVLKLQSKVNGELRQDSNTGLFIHGIEEVICELTKGMTLKAGTIIATGTPAGVGMGFVPPKFLKTGDVVECIIEGIGTLKNTVGE